MADRYPYVSGEGRIKSEFDAMKPKKAGSATPQEVASKYGLSWAIVSSSPDLMAWFNDFAKRYVAADGMISYERFKMELEAQPWWQQHSATWIADRQRELEDPVGYQQSIAGDIQVLKDYAEKIGATVTDQELFSLAQQSRRMGMNANQSQALVENYVKAVYTDGRLDYAGQAGVDQDAIQEWAYANGIGLSANMLAGAVEKIAKGELTVDELKSDIRKTYMAGAFPAWADQINAGMDIADIAQPYKTAMADILEINEDSIDFRDPLMQAGLQSVGPDGKARIMPLYEYQKMVRNDPRWQKTDNAYATYTNVAQDILRTFGFM